MAKILTIHPENPQPWLIQQAVELIRDGAVFAYPTDSSYALGCHLGDKAALDKIRQLRQLDKNHNFTLMCRDLSELSTYAQVNKHVYRLLKAHTPGAYTFILEATNDLPRRLMHPKRRTVGLRVPTNIIARALLTELNEPLVSVTLQLPETTEPVAEIETLPEGWVKQLDLIIDGGFCGITPTSVIDLTQSTPVILRRGKGDVQDFEAFN